MALALAARNLGTVCKPAGRDLSLGDESEIFIYGPEGSVPHCQAQRARGTLHGGRRRPSIYTSVRINKRRTIRHSFLR